MPAQTADQQEHYEKLKKEVKSAFQLVELQVRVPVFICQFTNPDIFSPIWPSAQKEFLVPRRGAPPLLEHTFPPLHVQLPFLTLTITPCIPHLFPFCSPTRCFSHDFRPRTSGGSATSERSPPSCGRWG